MLLEATSDSSRRNQLPGQIISFKYQMVEALYVAAKAHCSYRLAKHLNLK